MAPGQSATAPAGAGLFTQVEYLLLPSFALVAVLFGYIARITRAGVIEAIDADYTRTAYLKGLTQRQVVGTACAAQLAAARRSRSSRPRSAT